jgi:hypothetical protein
VSAATGARVVTSREIPGWVPVAHGRHARSATGVPLPPEPEPLAPPVLGGAALPTVGAPPPLGPR